MDASEIGTEISRLVQTSPNGQILGSALAVLVKRFHPDFRAEDFGCRNLRDFIRMYSKGVFEIAKRGTDVLYSASLLPAMSEGSTRAQEFRDMHAVPAHPPRPILPTQAWKTFTSPNEFYRLFANRASGEFRVLRRGDPPLSEPWVLVQSCLPSVHLQIARDFTENLSDEVAKIELAKVLGLESWWTHFFLAARRFGLEREWSAFRRRKLHAELDQQLKSLGVPLPVSPRRANSPAKSFAVPPPVVDDMFLRRIASAVIGKLPSSDLREVWLPLGYVLDEIGER